MKAVMPEVPPDILQWRKRTGIDRWDEMWEGVLHMPPMPNRYHQDLEWAMETWLRTFWARPRGNRVYHQINLASVGGWPNNYRIPDLVLLTPDRFEIDLNEYFEGPPTAVVEIHSPGDEAYEKFDFYAALGVPEVWVIQRDTRAPEVYTLAGGEYEQRPADPAGWLHGAATAIQLRGDPAGKLAMQIAGEPDTLRLVPED